MADVLWAVAVINRLLGWSFISTWGALVSFVNNGAGLLLISLTSLTVKQTWFSKGNSCPPHAQPASIEIREFWGNITEPNPALFGISQGAEVSFPVLQFSIQELIFGNLPRLLKVIFVKYMPANLPYLFAANLPSLAKQLWFVSWFKKYKPMRGKVSCFECYLTEILDSIASACQSDPWITFQSEQ